MICVGFGAYNPAMRLCGACCASCLCCTQFGIIVATGVYRYSTKAKLCALSLAETNYVTQDEIDGNWTYEKDAVLIEALWVIQIFTFMFCCAAGFCPLKYNNL